jgi:single-strand DNA-binding protein
MINKVTLIGHLGGDPEIRTLENGTLVGRFSLATNENYKDKEGNWQSQTEWHNVVVWREQAEKAKSLVKGNTVYVEGKISHRKYTDKDGVEKSLTDIVANYFRGLDKREASQTDNRSPEEPQAQTQPQRAQANPVQSQEPWQAKPNDGDLLPF